MTLVLFRIDDRLIHGQVVVGWGQALDLGFIVLVDDVIAQSEWERELYRIAVPPGIDVYFHSVASVGDALPRYREDPRPGLLLTGSAETMRVLAEAGAVPSVNVGGIHHRPDRTQRLRYVFLSAEEERALREIAARGVPVTAQDVPSARPVPLDELLDAQPVP